MSNGSETNIVIQAISGIDIAKVRQAITLYPNSGSALRMLLNAMRRVLRANRRRGRWNGERGSAVDILIAIGFSEDEIADQLDNAIRLETLREEQVARGMEIIQTAVLLIAALVTTAHAAAIEIDGRAMGSAEPADSGSRVILIVVVSLVIALIASFVWAVIERRRRRSHDPHGLPFGDVSKDSSWGDR